MVYDYLRSQYPNVFGGSSYQTLVEPPARVDLFENASQTQDPSNIHQYGDLFQPTEFKNPFDVTGQFRTSIQNTSFLLDGVNAQLDKSRTILDSLDTSAENNWGQVGAGLLGGLAVALGGGGAGNIALGINALGTSYYNNLEAHEKEKKARLDAQIQELEKSRVDLMNYSQALETAQLTEQMNQNRAFQSGQIIGSEPQQLLRQQSLEDKILERRATDRSVPVSPELLRKAEKENNLPEGSLRTQADITALAAMDRNELNREKFEAQKFRQGLKEEYMRSYPVVFEEGRQVDPEVFTKVVVPKLEQASQVVNGLEKVGDLIRSGGDTLMGLQGYELKLTGAQIAKGIKDNTGAGAAFTPFEASIYLPALEAFIASPSVENKQALILLFKKHNALEKINAAIPEMKRQFEDQTRIYGVTPDWNRISKRGALSKRSDFERLRQKYRRSSEN